MKVIEIGVDQAKGRDSSVVLISKDMLLKQLDKEIKALDDESLTISMRGKPNEAHRLTMLKDGVKLAKSLICAIGQ